jgi:hypothetical protein
MSFLFSVFVIEAHRLEVCEKNELCGMLRCKSDEVTEEEPHNLCVWLVFLTVDVVAALS